MKLLAEQTQTTIEVFTPHPIQQVDKGNTTAGICACRRTLELDNLY